MTVVFFPITTRKITIKEILKELEATGFEELSLFISCEKNNEIVAEFSEIKKTKIEIVLNTFPVGTTEESMISWTVGNMPTSAFVLVRNNCSFFSVFTLSKLLTESLLGYDVIMFKQSKKESKLKTGFRNIVSKLCKTFFNFKHYEGDIGMQYFGLQTQTLLKTTNITLLSKLNRWIAFNVQYIDLDLSPTKFGKTPIKKPIIWTSVYGVAFVATLFLSIFLQIFSNMSFLVSMLILLAFVVELSMGCYHFLELLNSKKIGSLTAKPEDAIDQRLLSPEKKTA